MNSKYQIIKFTKGELEKTEDLISIEEPLEISLKFKDKEKWITKSLSITMRTPGDDKDLVTGFLFNEQIIQNVKDIENIESFGDKVGQYNIQNKILVTLNNSQNINIDDVSILILSYKIKLNILYKFLCFIIKNTESFKKSLI